jgi:hypothetical protein
MEINLLLGSALKITNSAFPEVWNSIPEILSV